MNSFYTQEELKEFRFANLGKNVLISRKTSIYSPQKIEIGNHVRIDDFCILSGKIVIANYIHIAANTVLFSGEQGIYLEDFSNISGRCNLYAKSDDFSGEYMTNPMVGEKYTNIIDENIVVKKHAIIGCATTILPGVTIGEGCAIGSMSLVKNDTPDWSICAGNPTKVLKERSMNLIEKEKQFWKDLSQGKDIL